MKSCDVCGEPMLADELGLRHAGCRGRSTRGGAAEGAEPRRGSLTGTIRRAWSPVSRLMCG